MWHLTKTEVGPRRLTGSLLEWLRAEFLCYHLCGGGSREGIAVRTCRAFWTHIILFQWFFFSSKTHKQRVCLLILRLFVKGSNCRDFLPCGRAHSTSRARWRAWLKPEDRSVSAAALLTHCASRSSRCEQQVDLMGQWQSLEWAFERCTVVLMLHFVFVGFSKGSPSLHYQLLWVRMLPSCSLESCLWFSYSQNYFTKCQCAFNPKNYLV